MEPGQYSRRILLGVTGLSPQIITETLYALAVTGKPPFIPTEIHLITTADGAERARLTLLSDDPGWFHRLCRDYGLTGVRFDEDCIHVLRGAGGEGLSDIRTLADNAAAADRITEEVRALTADPDSALHASIAGGRKTMGFYLGYAMSLFGRAQDRLSHVLVSSPFESNQQFYYPTRESRVIFTLPPEQRPLDCRDAEVTLADIPFVRLRDGLQESLLEEGASFSEVVRQAQRNLAPPELVLDISNRRVRCGETLLRLTPISCTWLAWFARRASEGLPPLHWKRIGPTEVGAVLREHQAVLNDPLADDQHPVIRARRAEGITKEFFEERSSKLKRELSRTMGTRAALNYTVQRQGTERRSGYALNLEPHRIRFASLEGTENGKLAGLDRRPVHS